MKWIESGGGPLIVVPLAKLNCWRGVDRAPGAQKTDYDRACAVEEEVAVLEVEGQHAFILGDEPLRTAWVPTDDGGMFVRWVYADDEESLLNLPKGQELDDILEDTGLSLRIPGPCLIFDSAEPGYEILGDSDMILLPKGDYSVSSGTVQVSERACCLVHRLRRRTAELP
jgi:hypothetical protein